MSKHLDPKTCREIERITLFALRTLPSEQVPAVEVHLRECDSCREELDQLRPLVDYFVDKDGSGTRGPASLRERLAARIADAVGREIVLPTGRAAEDPDWEQVAPGIACKLLATDPVRDRVSMLVRLAPGVEYPPHTHAGVEELHLLEGELWIDERKLVPGEYNRAEPGTNDRRVWSETGCMCVLITSSKDVLG